MAVYREMTDYYVENRIIPYPKVFVFKHNYISNGNKAGQWETLSF